MNSLAARAFLLRATEPPAPAVAAFVAAHGPVDAVKRIRAGSLPRLVLQEIRDPEPRIDEDLVAIDAGRFRLLTPEDPDWPHGALRGLTEQGLGAPLGAVGSGHSRSRGEYRLGGVGGGKSRRFRIRRARRDHARH